jgi:hypothetical protein
MSNESNINIETIINYNNEPMSLIAQKEYIELRNIKIQKGFIDKQYAELLLSVHSYTEEIRILKEEKLLLEKTIENLTKRIQCLEDENQSVKDGIKTLMDEKEQKNKLIKMSQCIYNYKENIKNKIINNNSDLTKLLKRFDLFDILNGDFDHLLLKYQDLTIKDEIIQNMDNLYGSGNNDGHKILKNYFRDLTIERNNNSHPKITKEESVEIKQFFINYCNDKWENDPVNETIANDIFSIFL